MACGDIQSRYCTVSFNANRQTPSGNWGRESNEPIKPP